MPDDTSFRDELPMDAPAIDTIVASAFGRRHEANIVAQVRTDPALVLSMVATRRGTVVAHVLFSRVVVAPPSASAIALGPVSVAPQLQSSGIGTRLIDAAIARVSRAEFDLLFVLGNPRYYGRFGFEPAAPYGYHYGSRDYDRAFQVRAIGTAPIAPAYDAWVAYHAAFDDPA